jgi:hypothetical protein
MEAIQGMDEALEFGDRDDREDRSALRFGWTRKIST